LHSLLDIKKPDRTSLFFVEGAGVLTDPPLSGFYYFKYIISKKQGKI
jgi:hypothetical protein